MPIPTLVLWWAKAAPRCLPEASPVCRGEQQSTAAHALSNRCWLCNFNPATSHLPPSLLIQHFQPTHHPICYLQGRSGSCRVLYTSSQLGALYFKLFLPLNKMFEQRKNKSKKLASERLIQALSAGRGFFFASPPSPKFSNVLVTGRDFQGIK